MPRTASTRSDPAAGRRGAPGSRWRPRPASCTAAAAGAGRRRAGRAGHAPPPRAALRRATPPRSRWPARRSTVVGVIVHDIADPYFAEIAAGAMRVAREHDLMVIVANTFRDPELELDYLCPAARPAGPAPCCSPARAFTDARARLAGAELAAFTERGGRVAAIGGHGTPSTRSCPTTTAAAAWPPTHLAGARPHRAIGVIAGPPTWPPSPHRLAGFRQAVGRSPGRVADADFTREGGRAAAAAAGATTRADRDLRAERPDGRGRAGRAARAGPSRARRRLAWSASTTCRSPST